MSWARELCDVYDKNEKIVGVYETENLVLAPIFHTTVSAQITVVLNASGEFLSASLVPEKEKLTIIPVTEKSASRSSGIEAHPLCDNLKYVAGDYAKYVVPEKGMDYTKYYQKYMEVLQAWEKSEFSHKKVKSIYNYLKKSCLIQDLTKECLKLEEDGSLAKSVKIQNNISQVDAFIRFQVEEEWSEDRNLLETSLEQAEECWKDRTLHRAYIDYCRSQKKSWGLSYLTGNYMEISYLHPKGILKQNNMAKLISSNDSENFTFRGRFKDKEEAFAIGYEDSQKLHNALKWLLLKQGKDWASLSVVTWESDLQKLPDWSADTEQICEDYLEEDFFDEIEEKEEYMGANPLEASRFQKAIAGYGKKLKVNSKMQLMAFDAASKGRLAILVNENLSSSSYLKNLNKWHTDVAWYHWSQKKKHYYYGVVSVDNIAKLLYGNEQNDMIVLTKNNEKIKANICKRLIPCILFGKPLPEDLVHLAISKASSPLSYKNRYNWE